MAWRLQLLDEPPRGPDGRDEPGLCWFAPWLLPRYRGVADENFSTDYVRDFNGSRAPIVVLCPTDWGYCWPWVIDRPSSNQKPFGWTVTCKLPNITCRPSIGVPRANLDAGWCYHGWLTDGVLSNDLEGRLYPKWPATA